MVKLFFRRLLLALRLRRLTSAQRMAEDWATQNHSLSKRLARQEERLSKLRQSVYDRAESVAHDLDTARKLQQQHETVIESLRSENTVLGVEVSALTAANQLALERYRAETSIQTMRQVAAGSREER